MEHIFGNLRIRDNDTCDLAASVNGILQLKFLPVGWKLIGDKHYFNHMTYILCGIFKFEKWSGESDPKERSLLISEVVTGPCAFDIDANMYHNFECLETGILHCVFASLDPVTHEVTNEPNEWAAASGIRVPGPIPELTPRTARRRAEEGTV